CSSDLLRVFGDLIEFLHCGGYFQDLRRILLDRITDYQNIRSGLAHLAGLTPISDSSSYSQWNVGILLDPLDHSLADRLLRSAARVQIYDPQAEQLTGTGGTTGYVGFVAWYRHSLAHIRHRSGLPPVHEDISCRYDFQFTPAQVGSCSHMPSD